MVGVLVGTFVGELVGFFVGWLVGWFVGKFALLMVGQFVGETLFKICAVGEVTYTLSWLSLIPQTHCNILSVWQIATVSILFSI